MRILVVGAGAVGGYFGGRLIEAGRDTTFLVRPKRAELLNAKGLQILSPHGDFSVRPKTIAARQITEPYDLILLAVKSYALSQAMNDFAATVGPETKILPLLNGMRHVELLQARFGHGAILGGVCLIASEINFEGQIRQLAGFQKLIYGEMNGHTTPRLQEIDLTLRGSGFDVEISHHIVSDMWQKWVQLATWGAITCLMRGNIGEIASATGGAALSLETLRETSEIATACGYPPSDAFLSQQTKELTARGSNMAPSMYRDLNNGAPVESETIVGDLVQCGREHGLKTPILQAAFVNLSVYQNRRERANVSSAP